jgi:hypothetical protein
LEGRRKNASLPGVAGRSVTEPSTEITRSLQQNTPRRAVRADRARHLLEQHAQRIGAQLGPGP